MCTNYHIMLDIQQWQYYVLYLKILSPPWCPQDHAEPLRNHLENCLHCQSPHLVYEAQINSNFAALGLASHLLLEPGKMTSTELIFRQGKAPMKSQMLIKPLGLSTSFICAMEETASSWATQSNNQDIQSREVILHAIATMGKQPPRNTCAWIQYAAYGHGSWTNHLAANEPNFFGVKKSIQFSNVSIIQVGMNLFPKDLESFLCSSCCWAEWLQTPVMLHVQKPMLHPIHSSQPSQ